SPERDRERREGARLAMATAHHGGRRMAGRAQGRERAGRETGGLADGLDAGALHALDLPCPAAIDGPGHGDVRGAQGDPYLSESERVVQIGERVQLDWGTVPGRLDLAAQLGRQPGRLVGVARYDLRVEDVKVSRHARDPCSKVQT